MSEKGKRPRENNTNHVPDSDVFRDLAPLMIELARVTTYDEIGQLLLTKLWQMTGCTSAGVIVRDQQRCRVFIRHGQPLSQEGLEQFSIHIGNRCNELTGSDAEVKNEPGDITANLTSGITLNSFCEVPIHTGERILGYLMAGWENEPEYEKANLIMAALSYIAAYAFYHADDLTRFENERLHAIIAYLPVGVALLTGDGGVILANELAYTILRQLSGRRRKLITIDRLGDVPLKELQKSPGEAQEIVWGQPWPRTYYVSISPTTTAGEHPTTYWVLVLNDITEKKSQEALMRQREFLTSLGHLAGGIAHDFNNMLTAIIGNTELALEDTPSSDTRYELLTAVRDTSIRAAEVTKQLLAYSRKQMLSPKSIDLNDCVISVARMMERFLRPNVQLELQLADELWPVYADPAQIEQVLLHLLMNAHEALADGGTITISTTDINITAADVATDSRLKVGEQASVTVSDTGMGIPQEQLAHVFEPFYSTKALGRGMGLATVFGIVEQSGGHILVSSVVNKGTAFSVYLMREREAKAAEGEKMEMEASDKLTVLLIEDEPSVQRLAQRALQRLGYTVLSAPDCATAFTQFKEHQNVIDLILTDLSLPDGDGHSLVQKLRQHRPELKVIYSSGYADDISHYQSSLSKIDAFLPKPYDLRQLEAVVKRILS